MKLKRLNNFHGLMNSEITIFIVDLQIKYIELIVQTMKLNKDIHQIPLSNRHGNFILLL